MSKTPARTLTFAALALTACTEDPADPELEALELRSVPTDSLELHWSFEDHLGNQIVDLSGNGRHGTLHGGSFVDSTRGEAVALDGIDDYISFPGPRDPALYGGVEGSFTLHARVRVADVAKLNTLCYGCGPSSIVYVGSDMISGRIFAAVRDQSNSGHIWPVTNEVLSNDTWVDYTMVVEGGVGVRSYVDCALDSELENANVGLHDYNYSVVGMGALADRWYGGEIDELRIWSRALSEQEVEAICSTADLCSGAPEGPDLVTPPAPPTSYALPVDDVITVSDAAELEFRVNEGVYGNIILADGNYSFVDLSTDWLQIEGHHLWAEHVGQAVLDFGIDLGGTKPEAMGPELHGLAFDIEDHTHTPGAEWLHVYNHTAAVSGWGYGGEGVVIEDCTFNGHGAVARAISTTSDQVVISRVEIEDFARFGIFLSSGGYDPALLSDIRIRDIQDPDCWGDEAACKYAAGSEEIGLYFSAGNPAGSISRVSIRDARAHGIVVDNSVYDIELEDIDIDRIGVGQSSYGTAVYLSSTNRDATLHNFCIGPQTRIGVNTDWDRWCDVENPNCTTHPSDMGPKAIRPTIRDGLIESSRIGVHFDQGVAEGLVENTIFRGYSQAGIVMFNNLSDFDLWPAYDDGGLQQGNTFEETEIEGQTCGLTYDFWLDASPHCE